MTQSEFIQLLGSLKDITVLEVGTKRSIPDRPTHHRSWCHQTANFIMSDFEDGLDVDVVCDIHSLTDAFSLDSIDFVICCSIFEHVQRPWIAAREIARVLKPGGMVFVQTHQTFPIHGYPSDYWRYTTEALRTIFEDAELETVDTAYDFPAQIVSEDDRDARRHPAFLNATILARKPLDWSDLGIVGMTAGGLPLDAALRMQAELSRHRGAAASLRSEINSLRSSTSWRITAPLRAFGRRLLGRP
jgi:SAM-dependent methyltransferase